MAIPAPHERPVRPIPEGYHTLTPSLTLHDAATAIEFYVRAFGAKELSRALAPDGKKIWHAELQIGDSRLMLNDEFPEMGSRSARSLGGAPVTLWMYVEDADALFERAVAAGATATMPVGDMFWGDRMGMLLDPFGQAWGIATRVGEHDAVEEQRTMDAWTAKHG